MEIKPKKPYFRALLPYYMDSHVFLYHRDRPGKPLAVKKSHFEANKGAYLREGWRIADEKMIAQYYGKGEEAKATEKPKKARKKASESDKKENSN